MQQQYHFIRIHTYINKINILKSNIKKDIEQLYRGKMVEFGVGFEFDRRRKKVDLDDASCGGTTQGLKTLMKPFVC